MNEPLIDDLEKLEPNYPQLQQNLLPVGAMVLIVLVSFFSLVLDIIEPIGIKFKVEPFTTLWLGVTGGLFLTSFIGFSMVKDLWKRIAKKRFHQKKYIIILVFLTALIYGLKILFASFTNSFYSQIMEGKIGFFYLPGYLEFKTLFFRISFGILALSILIVLGRKTPQTKKININ